MTIAGSYRETSSCGTSGIMQIAFSTREKGWGFCKISLEVKITDEYFEIVVRSLAK